MVSSETGTAFGGRIWSRNSVNRIARMLWDKIRISLREADAEVRIAEEIMARVMEIQVDERWNMLRDANGRVRETVDIMLETAKLIYDYNLDIFNY